MSSLQMDRWARMVDEHNNERQLGAVRAAETQKIQAAEKFIAERNEVIYNQSQRKVGATSGGGSNKPFNEMTEAEREQYLRFLRGDNTNERAPLEEQQYSRRRTNQRPQKVR